MLPCFLPSFLPFCALPASRRRCNNKILRIWSHKPTSTFKLSEIQTPPHSNFQKYKLTHFQTFRKQKPHWFSEFQRNRKISIKCFLQTRWGEVKRCMGKGQEPLRNVNSWILDGLFASNTLVVLLLHYFYTLPHFTASFYPFSSQQLSNLIFSLQYTASRKKSYHDAIAPCSCAFTRKVQSSFAMLCLCLFAILYNNPHTWNSTTSLCNAFHCFTRICSPCTVPCICPVVLCAEELYLDKGPIQHFHLTLPTLSQDDKESRWFLVFDRELRFVGAGLISLYFDKGLASTPLIIQKIW